ncbi:hypothetical protein [Deinococcus cellulosilyticus]|uniref:Uncharacterized protein n=1 Tax=Deinococcus cellulosilyticus (strain DSM 18568 / NBRC 106333 / KACC 11606 / 5516J-15) TaxID=1223518 RepID=A0A511N915_DEIC1|nr:hypothetical protein [Deinococcus cellulosilyticus]GEM49343.1 hypothetical protein DC3_49780 [Deinococcus cellulosilyticus NBRC 106333 = KACC 11606]
MLETFNPRNWRQLVEPEDHVRLKFFDDRGVVFQWLDVLDEVVYSESPRNASQRLLSRFPPHTFQAVLKAGVVAEQEIHPLGPYCTIHMLLDQVADLLTLAGLRVPQLPYD